jgi:hypothetical protein
MGSALSLAKRPTPPHPLGKIHVPPVRIDSSTLLAFVLSSNSLPLLDWELSAVMICPNSLARVTPTDYEIFGKS